MCWCSVIDIKSCEWYIFRLVVLTATTLTSTPPLWAASHCTPCLISSRSRWMEPSLMDLDTKVTAVQHSLLHRPCKCRLHSSPISSVRWTQLWFNVIMRSQVLITISPCCSPALKKSRRTRRYVKIIPTSLRRARTSTATARRWTKMKTTAARTGPAFTWIACLLSDYEVRVLCRKKKKKRPPHSQPVWLCTPKVSKKTNCFIYITKHSLLGEFLFSYLSAFLFFFFSFFFFFFLI